MVLSMAHEPDQFTSQFLRDLHRTCMRSSTVLPMKSRPEEERELALKYLNIGVTRQTSRKNVMIPGPPRVQFCPFERVDDELGKFTHLARVGFLFLNFARFKISRQISLSNG
jgi:hypothetical protein